MRGQFLKADDEVMRETGEITGTLKGFRTDAAIATFQERWRDQISYVKQEFTATESALRKAARMFATQERVLQNAFDGIFDGTAGTKDSHAPAGRAGT